MALLPYLTRTLSWVLRGDFIQKLTLDGWNYPWLELISMVPSLFEPWKFYCIICSLVFELSIKYSLEKLYSNLTDLTFVVCLFGWCLKGLSYDVVVIQWITSCQKNYMIPHVIPLRRQRVTSLTTSVSTMCFLNIILFSSKAIRSHFKGSCDKQNLTLVVILYEIYKTR